MSPKDLQTHLQMLSTVRSPEEIFGQVSNQGWCTFSRPKSIRMLSGSLLRNRKPLCSAIVPQSTHSGTDGHRAIARGCKAGGQYLQVPAGRVATAADHGGIHRMLHECSEVVRGAVTTPRNSFRGFLAEES